MNFATTDEQLDILPFGHTFTWRADGELQVIDLPCIAVDGVGVEWIEDRDVSSVRVTFTTVPCPEIKLEYWQRQWPYDRPGEPNTEDPVDDPWQGSWVLAKTAVETGANPSERSLKVLELGGGESRTADRLTNLRYRRTLKIRLLFSEPASVERMAIYTETRLRDESIYIDVPMGDEWRSPSDIELKVSNGKLHSWHVVGVENDMTAIDSGRGAIWRIIADIATAVPSLPGSLDVTIVSVRSSSSDTHSGSFSFLVDDLQAGPIDIVRKRIHIELAPGSESAPAEHGDLHASSLTRDLVLLEPEQTLERAMQEIPKLDPWVRQDGNPAYLPLALDSSWQKFALSYDGTIFAQKHPALIRGRELSRLDWNGDRLAWKISVGGLAVESDDRKPTVTLLEDSLPVVTQRWEHDDLSVSQEVFVTALRGNLSPFGGQRSEEVPAILLLKVSIGNKSNRLRTCSVALKMDPWEILECENNVVRARRDGAGELANAPVRAVVSGGESVLADGLDVSVARSVDGASALTVSADVPAETTRSVVFKIPFVSDLDEQDVSELKNLNYEWELQRIGEYWAEVTSFAARIKIPEKRFEQLIRATLAHIRLTAVKDPKAGVLLAPAASIVYPVFANEACFQAMLLDELGDTSTAETILSTFLTLQGSRTYPGLQSDESGALLHGTRVSNSYDYSQASYGLNHGTVLFALGRHFLLSRDLAWWRSVWPGVRRACEWIADQRRAVPPASVRGLSTYDWEAGLLPPGHMEDNSDWAQWYSVNATAWSGLNCVADALECQGSAEAPAIRAEAEAYREDILASVSRWSAKSPVVRFRDGSYGSYVPSRARQRSRFFGPHRRDLYLRYGSGGSNTMLRLSATRDVLYGPLTLLELGVLDFRSELAEDILNDWEDNLTVSSGMGMNVHGFTDPKKWFSQGGLAFQANLQNPSQVYVLRHEPEAAIRSLYNAYSSCIYSDVNMFTEEFRTWGLGSGPFYKSPDEARFCSYLARALVCEDDGVLWLCAATPRRWLDAGSPGVQAQGVRTRFGSVSLEMHRHGSRVEAIVDLPADEGLRAAWLVVRKSPAGLSRAEIEGYPDVVIDRECEAVGLPLGGGRLRVLAE